MVAVSFYMGTVSAPMLWALIAISAVSLLVLLPSFTWTWQRVIAAIAVIAVVLILSAPREFWGIYIYWPWDWWPYCFCLSLLGR